MPDSVILSADVVAEAIMMAKAADQAEFRDNEYAWIQANNLLAGIAIDNFFVHEGRKDFETGDAGRQGLLLGNFILRSLAENGGLDYGIVQENQKRHLVGIQFAYGGEIPAEELWPVFGLATKPVLSISHPVARTMCAAYMGVSLSRLITSPFEKSLQFTGGNRIKDRQIRRQGRPR